MENQVTVLPGIDKLPLSGNQLLFFTQQTCHELFQLPKNHEFDSHSEIQAVIQDKSKTIDKFINTINHTTSNSCSSFTIFHRDSQIYRKNNFDGPANTFKCNKMINYDNTNTSIERNSSTDRNQNGESYPQAMLFLNTQKEKYGQKNNNESELGEINQAKNYIYIENEEQQPQSKLAQQQALQYINKPNNSEDIQIKGVWAKFEDNILIRAVSEFIGEKIDWNLVASKVPHRSPKQCKERWIYRLAPAVKKIPFEKWEDEIVVRERVTFGNHWTLIARKLPGRTTVAVKNRWYSVLRHRYKDFVGSECKKC